MSQMKVETNDNEHRLSVYMPSGFHGDPYLMQLIDSFAGECIQFIETGTEAGSTVGYVARMYPHMECYTAETDPGTHELAKYNTANHPNIDHSNIHSLEFLKELPPSIETPALFWLDAHSHGWGCDLGEEVDIILQRWSSGYIFLDDFQVPGREDFGFDWYDTFGKLNWETVSADITPEMMERIKGIYYPEYIPPYGTRGWLLIRFGDVPDWTMPGFVKEASKGVVLQ